MTTKAAMIAEIGTNFPDNTTGLITPALLRTTTTDMVNSYQQGPVIRTVTAASDALVVGDYGNMVVYNNAVGVAVSLAQATGSFAQFSVFVKNIGAGTVTITPSISTINGAASLALTQNQSAFLVSDGANYQTWAIVSPPGTVTAASVTWTQSGTGAVGTNVDARLKQLYVTIQDFGGSTGAAAATNDTAIANALAFLASIGGGVLFFPRGTYNISATITVSSSFIGLMGEGRTATFINATVALNPMVNVTGAITLCSVRGMGFTSSGAVSPSCIQVLNTNETLLEDLYINGQNTQINFGIIVSSDGSGYYTRIHRCWVNICFGTAVYITGSAGLGNQLVELVSCNIGCNNVCNYGVFLDRGSCVLVNTGVLQAVLDGIHITPINGGPISCVGIFASADTCGKNGWFFSNSGGLTPVAQLTACWGSSANGVQPDGNGFFFHGCTGVQMTGCQAWNNNFGGILIDDNSSALRLNISNCEVFANNRSNNASGHGIYCGTNIPFLNVGHGTISTNTINALTGHQRFGIFINTGSSGLVTGALTGGNVTGGISNGSAGVLLGSNN